MKPSNLARLAYVGMLLLMMPSVQAEILSIDGTLKSVDSKKRTITVETGTKELILDVGSKAKITAEGSITTLEKLESGRRITLSFHDQLEVVVSIETFSENPEVAKNDFVPLFNGKDLSGWQGKVGDPPQISKMSSTQLKAAQKRANDLAKQHWRVRNGVLIYDGQGTSLVTVRNFRDFELLLDWKIQSNGDSGVFLRGCPQVQIWDPEKNGANGVGSGGLYNNKRNPSQPSKRADRPVGEWNAMRIRMIGEIVSIWLNDELVVDEVRMENHFYPEQPIFPDGPFELQHHGGILEFRNIMVKEFN